MTKLTDNELFEIIGALAQSDKQVSDELLKRLKQQSEVISDELVINHYHEKRGTGQPLPTTSTSTPIDKPWNR